VAGLRGPVGSLPNQIYHPGHAGAELVLVLRGARGFVQHRRDGARVQLAQLLLTADLADEGGIVAHGLIVARHASAELGLDPEQVAKVLIRGQDPVQQLVTDDDGFHLQRNGFRFERDGGDQAIELVDGFDTDLARPQRPLEPVPGHWLGEEIPGLQHKVPAVRPMQRPRLDLREIGRHGAELSAELDAPDEVLVRRIRLDNDGRAAVWA